MSETLFIRILSISENNEKQNNCSCNLILGSRLAKSNIPTKPEIKLVIADVPEHENLTVLIKQNGQTIAKTLIPLADLRKNSNASYHLEALGNKADIGSIFSWDCSFHVSSQGESQQASENPFEQNLEKQEVKLSPEEEARLRGSLGDNLYQSQGEHDKANEQKNPHTFAAIPAETQSLTHAEGQSPIKNKLDVLLQTLDAKIREEVNIEGFDPAEVEKIMENLKASIDELQKEVGVHQVTAAAQTTQFENNPSLLANSGQFSGKFSQTAPHFAPADFAQTREQESPIYPSGGFSATQPLPQNSNLLGVPKESNRKLSGDGGSGYETGVIEKLNQSRRLSHNFNNESIIDDVKIEKNEDYLLSMRNQLTSKNIAFINDAFTRDIILHMAQTKKKISAVRLRRSITIGDKDDVEIDKKEFFNPNCHTKFLHFFQASSKYLHLFNLVQPFDLVEEKPRKISLDIDFDISAFHRSAITPAGLIYIAAGQSQYNASGVDVGSNSLHAYNYKTQSLVERAPMECKTRQQFGLCYMSKNLFVVGGLVNGEISASCERYDIRSNKWIKLAPMNRALREVSICSFNNRYLFRVFGINSGNNIDHTVERYDAVRDTWTTMNVTVSPILKEIYGPFCTQIGPDSVFIFGGNNINGFSPKSCKGWVLKVEDKRGSNNAELIVSRNFIPGLAGTFNKNSLLTHSGDIVFLREGY